ncbi:hypothetical protein DPMN_005036 [Dreissena polymorpha]|uniref:Uncharacterized protein n=1 Tax=Dreissena polymorpha TaxID=45954 RepID=A0A9D4RU24_DREPO|nr:hypothetical protein DPMN_005036 [Dreissena polymorpha]
MPTFSLRRAGELSTTIALSTLEYLEQEVDYVPWLAARTQLDYLNNMLRQNGHVRVI